MRTVLRFGMAVGITTLVAGVAASCALPAYEASSSSGSGGGAASSSSGKASASSAQSSSSGQSASSSSSSKASSSSGLPDGGDGGKCTEWMPCDIAAVKGTHCDCPGQRCNDPQCKN